MGTAGRTDVRTLVGVSAVNVSVTQPARRQDKQALVLNSSTCWVSETGKHKQDQLIEWQKVTLFLNLEIAACASALRQQSQNMNRQLAF